MAATAMSSSLSRPLFIVQSECVVQDQARFLSFGVVARRFTHRYKEILVELSLNFKEYLPLNMFDENSSLISKCSDNYSSVLW